MIRVFLDTEFTDLTADAKLISIGLVAEDGVRCFYAELADTYCLKNVGDYARKTVLPLLDGGPALVTMQQLGQRLVTWLESFGEPVRLATDSLTWDWAWIQKICYEQGQWPENLDGQPLLLTMNYLNDFDEFLRATEIAYCDGLRRHHALDDAKAHRLGWIAAGGDIEDVRLSHS